MKLYVVEELTEDGEWFPVQQANGYGPIRAYFERLQASAHAYVANNQAHGRPIRVIAYARCSEWS